MVCSDGLKFGTSLVVAAEAGLPVETVRGLELSSELVRVQGFGIQVLDSIIDANHIRGFVAKLVDVREFTYSSVKAPCLDRRTAMMTKAKWSEQCDPTLNKGETQYAEYSRDLRSTAATLEHRSIRSWNWHSMDDGGDPVIKVTLQHLLHDASLSRRNTNTYVMAAATKAAVSFMVIEVRLGCLRLIACVGRMSDDRDQLVS